MAALTAEQVLWYQGYWSFFQKDPRPTKVGPKQDGWDAAKRCSQAGGYA
jgi:hypothetical protein